MFEMNTKSFLLGSKNPKNIIDTLVYKSKFKKEHSDFFYPEGLLVFCGFQGSGKTLSAVNYISQISYEFPKCLIVTNTDLNCLNPESEVIEYNGVESLTEINNGEYGVLYFIDEIQLEFNSLESKKIGPEVFTEISQQRKQRKHIVGTSQVYGRLAKPFREQIRWVVDCHNYLGLIQFNRLIDGNSAYEKDGELHFESSKPFFWFHSPKLYSGYDTYAKMKRYRKEWNK